ncbi:MAG: hypothetical protein WCF08_08745 [Anaerolineaceae bacterium]
MLIILPAAILSVTIIIMVVMQRREVGRGLVWSAAAMGSTAAIIVSLFLVRALPIELVIRSGAVSIFNRLPFTLTLDQTAWAFQTALLAILSAVLLTATRRQASSGPGAWLGALGIAMVGLVAVQAGSLSTLLSAWFIIDTLELVVLLVSLKPSHNLGKLATSFLLRYAGILLAFITIIQPGDQTINNVNIYLFLAVMLRLGALPFWPYWGDTKTLTGLGTMMLAVRVTSVLVPLAHLTPGSIPPQWKALLTTYCLLLIFYCAIQWLRLAAAQDGRVYWVIGYGLVACMCVIHDQASSGVMWGVTALLCGSSLFLMTDRSRFYIGLPVAGLLAMTGLPYTPISSGWSGLLGAPVDWRATPFIIAHVLYLTGFLRLAFKAGESEGKMEGLSRFAYPAGLILLLIMPWAILLAAGVETPLLDWWAGFITFALFLITIIIFRAQLFEDTELKIPTSSFWTTSKRILDRILAALQQDWLVNFFNQFFGWVGRITSVISNILEGDGGVLWVLLLLALFATLISGSGGI